MTGACHRFAPPKPPRSLSPRQYQVLQLLVTGATDREIGEAMGISEGVVKLHVSEIKGKVGRGTRVWLAMYAIKRGLVALPELA